jgi:hypothetical protein
MYSTCLFCHGPLGSNEAIEHFPIGRRLAFDAAKGRLWVVCPRCARWNLTPLEERWEAVEECERLFRTQRLRSQTEHIGLAKLPEGLVLIRIGRPLRPEFAAWRYGDVFGDRLRRHLVWLGVGAVAAGVGGTVGLVTGVLQAAFMAIPPVVAWGVNGIRVYRDHLRTTYVPRTGQRPYLVFGADIKETDLAPGAAPGEWMLNFRHVAGTEHLVGDAARRALGILMTRVNASGAAVATTRAAAERIAAAGSPDAFIAGLARSSQQRTGDFRQRRANFLRTGLGDRPPVDRGALPYLERDERLALEMAVHEEEERRALEEEIGPLEAAWKEAEAIAAIADDLLTPSSTHEFIAKHRSRGVR